MSEVISPKLPDQASIEVPQDAAPPAPSLTMDAVHRLRRNPVAMLCLAYICVLVFVAIFANFLAPYAYDFQDTKRYDILPANADHFHRLGTDTLGQDVLSRLLYGARVSLGVSLVVVVLEVSIGLTLGLYAGYFSGKTDLFLMRVTDIMFAFPDLLLAILLSAVVRASSQAIPPALSIVTLFFALGIVAWPGMARLVRGQALALREKEFVEAARSMGVRNGTIIWKHIFPNLLSPIIVQVTQDVAGVILSEATLSFLGLGVQPPFPSWGRMINEALSFKESHPWLLIWPSLVLALTVMAFNFFGDALRDALDPRLRQ